MAKIVCEFDKLASMESEQFEWERGEEMELEDGEDVKAHSSVGETMLVDT